MAVRVLVMSDPSPPAESQSGARAPRAYLGWSVVVSIACFLPLGLVAIYYGFRTNRALVEGRLDDAARASRVTRRWLVVTIAVGLLVYVAIGAVFVLLGAFSP